MFLKFYFLFFYLICLSNGKKNLVSYDSKMLKARQAQLEDLKKNLDFFDLPNKVGKKITSFVNSKDFKKLEQFLNSLKIKNTTDPVNIFRNDVQSRMFTGRTHTSEIPSGGVTFKSFMTYDEIQEYLQKLANTYPEFVTLETIGLTYEKRNLTVIIISEVSCDTQVEKPVIFIDAGIHSREWAAPAMALFIIHQLLEHPSNKKYISDVTWVILPLFNPDGYEYSRNVYPLWRKNRSPNSKCKGVDLNRNFGYKWQKVGTSKMQCSDTYGGEAPFSENESKAFAIYISKIKNLKLYLSIHSCGTYLLYPWGWALLRSSNYKKLREVASSVREAIKSVRNTTYTIGNSAKVLYPASGASDDWVKKTLGVPLTYTIELPCGGKHGFNLPEKEILPVVTETWEGIKVFHNSVLSIND